MTWTGLLQAVCFSILSITVLWGTIGNWRRLRLTTKVFCFLYVTFLLLRGCTLLSVPDTGSNIALALVTMILMFPLLVCVGRIMKMGDPFEIASLANKAMYNKCADCKYPADRRLNELHSRIGKTLDELDRIIEAKK